MLSKRMQVQYIADRLAGLPVQADARQFSHPWLLCWNAIASAPLGMEHETLYQAIQGLPEQKEILQAILGTRPGYRPHFPSMAEVANNLPPIEWIWEGWIPRGLLTVLGASQGSGKSFVALDLAWRIIANRGYPDGAPIRRPGANVLYVDGEIVPQILNQRMDWYGLDKSKLYIMLPDANETLDLGQERYQERLTEMVNLLQPELIVIDSLSTIHTNGQNGVEDLRPLIGYLTRLAGWSNCGLVLIHHIRKPPNGGARMMNADFGMEDLSGAGYITQQARVVLGMRVVQTGPQFDPNGPREFKMLKNNLGPYPKPLGFAFKPLYPQGVLIDWQTQAPQAYREPTQRDECREWLEDLLRANPEGMKVKEVLTAGREQGFSQDMIYRTRRELRGRIINTSGWKSPNNCWKWNDAIKTEDAEHLQDSEHLQGFGLV